MEITLTLNTEEVETLTIMKEDAGPGAAYLTDEEYAQTLFRDILHHYPPLPPSATKQTRDVLNDTTLEIGGALELIRAELSMYGSHLQTFVPDHIPADYLHHEEFTSIMLRLLESIEESTARIEKLI